MQVKTNDLHQVFEHDRQSWQSAFPGNPFDIIILDNYFSAQYQNEQRFGKLATVFALLAILVGCLWLPGQTGYSIEQRTKEIGIRKVLGATHAGLDSLLSKNMAKLVAVAIVLAAPLAWWAMDNGLQDFASRIDISWWVFVLTGGIAVGVAFLTVSYQSMKAALINSVASPKNE